MSFSVFLARHRRLLATCLASLLLHLLALAWIDARLAPPGVTIGNPALALRLADAPATLATPPLPATPAAPERDLPAPTTARDASQVLPAPVAVAEAAPPGTVGDVVPVRMPNTYRVSPPPSGRIDYTVTHSAPGAPPRSAGQASMVWHSDGNSYTVQIDGVMGRLASEGQVDDAGIAPERAQRAVGSGMATTTFDRARGMIDAAGGGAEQLAPGSQDAASVLLQLAGIGLGDARQLNKELEFWLGGAGGAGVERYQVLGVERIETGAGPLETVRLARLAEGGAGRLELWLAPQYAWMPVQLRMTGSDGAVSTQTLATAAIDPLPTTTEE